MDIYVSLSRRSHPELNGIELFYKHCFNPNTYISFTATSKLDINSHSLFSVNPNGIYCYALADYQKEITRVYKQFIKQQKIVEESKETDVSIAEIELQRINQDISFFPHATWQKFGIIFYNPPQGILNFSNYTKGRFLADKYLLSKIYGNTLYPSAIFSPPGRRIWSLTRAIAAKVNKGATGTRLAQAWTDIFQKIGYTGIHDHGAGIILAKEPKQTVIFSSENTQIIKIFENKSYSKDNSLAETRLSSLKENTAFKYLETDEQLMGNRL